MRDVCSVLIKVSGKSVFPIRMDPGFFADPGFNNQDPDAYFFCFNLIKKNPEKCIQIFYKKCQNVHYKHSTVLYV